MTKPASSIRLPFVGRAEDLTRLRGQLERARGGRGGVVFLSGEGGVGKSRLASILADEARRNRWTVAEGRAYPVESGVPYALFSDALLPTLRELGQEKLAVLTRGAEAELEVLFPLLRRATATAGAPSHATARAAESSLQLHWTFAQFLKALGARGPLLIVLDDLHWADASSLELLHFAARHLGDSPILLLATFNEEERQEMPALIGVEQSLAGLGAATTHHLDPLGRAEVDALVRETFGAGESVTREFTALLYGWTRGNPFFIEETLKALVESGRLRRASGGQWLGWEMDALELPGSIRDALMVRLTRLSASSRELAEVVGIIGTRARYETLRAVCSLSEPRLVEALEELVRRNVLAETSGERSTLYDFQHPLVRQIVVGEIGLARQRLLHGRIALTLEHAYGARAQEHAEELALHFARGAVEGGAGKAVRYLAAAGRSALARCASREAADHLSEALERLDDAGQAGGDPEADGPERFALMGDLARAWQRLGEYERAIGLWREARDDAARRGDLNGVASMERRIGLAHFWAGRRAEALQVFDAALSAAGGDAPMEGRIRMARGVCLYMVGRGAEARSELERALVVAQGTQDPSLLARVHRALLLYHAWAGESEPAFAHGLRAVTLAEQTGNLSVACACHWGMAVVAGLTGRSRECAYHLEAGTRLADQLRSPLLRLAFDEVAVEYAFSTGAWDDGIALGEKAIAMARSLNQRPLLPRLLVWTGLIYLGRDERDRARTYFDEAWTLSGADDPVHARDVHSVIPAHIGLATYHLAVENLDEAIRVAEGGLALADGTGYTIWALHRLLAVLGEAYLRKRELPTARRIGARLRREAEPIGHVLGVAWADACEAILAWLDGDPSRGAMLLHGAADALDQVPFVPDAARIRRQLAGRLADLGDRDGALRELRRVHDVFLRLGAQDELRRARVQFHELEARPPSRPSGPGVEGLTSREVDIIRLIAVRRSNKAIAQALGISPRTVTTHLSNIYQKLAISSRGELADMAPRILTDA